MAFAFKFDFPPFMVLIIALLNDGTIMTLSVGTSLCLLFNSHLLTWCVLTDRVLPSNTPDSWDLGEIFAYAVAYGIYQAIGTIAFYLFIVETTFCSDRLGLENITDGNGETMHMQVFSLSSRRILSLLAEYSPFSEFLPFFSRNSSNRALVLYRLVYLQVAIISQALVSNLLLSLVE